MRMSLVNLPFEEVWAKVLKKLPKRFLLVGYNTHGYDLPVIFYEIQRAEKRTGRKLPTLECEYSLDLMVQYMRNPLRTTSYRLVECYSHYLKKEMKGNHNAGKDALGVP